MRSTTDARCGARTVLVAEDDVEMRGLMVTTFQRAGFAVIEARDGLEAYALARPGADAPPPSAVVSDVWMPGGTGLQLVRVLRRAQVTVPVILLSGFAAEDARREAKELGAVLLAKPIDLDVLAAVVRAVLDRAHPAVH